MKQYSLVTIECNDLQSYVEDQQPSSLFCFYISIGHFQFCIWFLLGELFALRRIVEFWGCHLVAFQHAVGYYLSGTSLKDAELLA